MNNKQLINSKELQSEIFKLGHFVKRYVNGIFNNEYDLANPCAFDYAIHSKLFPLEGEYNQVIIKRGIIIIIMKNGNIVELVKSNRKYYCKESITNFAKEAFLGKDLLLETQYLESNREKEIDVKKIKYDEAIQIIESSFKYGNISIREKDFCVNMEGEKFISIEFATKGVNVLPCNTKIFVLSDSKVKSFHPKIIQSNKFRTHMQVHEKDFIIPYQNIIRYALYKEYFNDINERFVEMVVEFPFDIGYSLICETIAQDTIVYAKRKNREIYSRFTLDGEKKLTNKCVFVLNRSNQKPEEYYLITMFPGEYLVKEPQDKNIKDELERHRMLEFWENHAFVFNPKDVDLETATYSCPFGLGA